MRAWQAGLAWAFIIGVIVLIGAFIGPFIRKITPRAALLGTLAGISISFISMRPAAQIWEAAWIGLPVLGIILVGFFTDLKLPGGIPVGLAALLVGTAIGWIGGYMSVPDVAAAASDIAIAVPTLNLALLFDGLGGMAPLLATAIPLGVYNFLEAMSNVESAAAAGDSYNLRSVLLADGTGAIVGSALGSPFPPAVYIGHPGWKEAGGRAGYSMASGLFIALLCFLGLFGVLSTQCCRLPAIVPILLYIGLLIGAQAFQSTPRLHAAAVVAAIIPNLAAWGAGLIDNALAAAGTTAAELGEEALTGAGLVYHGLHVARPGRDAGRHRARRHRHLHPGEAAVPGRPRGRHRRRAVLDRAAARRAGGLGRGPPGGSRLRDARRRPGRHRPAPAEVGRQPPADELEELSADEEVPAEV